MLSFQPSNVYETGSGPNGCDSYAFESAGFMAFREAVSPANPVLLEPLMEISITVPDEFIAAIISDLTARRGEIEGMASSAGTAIHALVPLAEMIGFGEELRSATQGRASCASEFASYQPVLFPTSNPDEQVGVTANRPKKPKPRSGVQKLDLPFDDMGD